MGAETIAASDPTSLSKAVKDPSCRGNWLTRALKASEAPKVFRLFPLLGFATLIAAALAGLRRLGLEWPAPLPMIGTHGLVMVGGFLGLVIGSERAVALQERWAWSVPLLGLAGTTAVLFQEIYTAWILYLVQALFFCAVGARLLFRQRTLPMALMFLAAIAWAAGVLIWRRQGASFAVTLLWAAFPIWTVVAERMELAAGARVTQTGKVLLFVLLGAYSGSLLSSGPTAAGLMAACLVLLGPWLIRYDVARLHLKHQGERRFMAYALLGGYAWISIAGLFAWQAMTQGGFARDAFLHCLFLGFLFSMIFAHATLIFPSLIGRPMQWHRGYYLTLALLYASLALRIGGDMTASVPLRQWGGIGNAAALVLFLASNLFALRLGANAKISGAAR